MPANKLTQNQLQSKKQKLWTPGFILICLSTLSVYIAFHSLLPTLPLYIQKAGGSEKTVGLALAFLTVAAVIIRPLTGWALDSYGRKLILLVGLLIFLIPSLVYISMVGIIPLLIFRLIQGFGWGISNTAQGTAASDLIPKNRLGEGLGFYGLTTSMSLATAPAIGLWLVDTFSFRILFITSGVLTLISLLFAVSINYSKVERQSARAKMVFIEKLALRPSIIILLVTITYSSLLSFLTLFVKQKGMSSAGLFFTTLAITTLLSRPFCGKILDRKGQHGYDYTVITGLSAIISAMLVLAQTSSIWYLVTSGILFGIGFGFVQPTLLAICIHSVPAIRGGAANATYWTAFDIGVAAGSIFWGIVANSFGYVAMFNLTTIPTIIALIIYLLNRKPTKS